MKLYLFWTADWKYLIFKTKQQQQIEYTLEIVTVVNKQNKIQSFWMI